MVARRCPSSFFLEVKVVAHTRQDGLGEAKEGVLGVGTALGNWSGAWTGALIDPPGGIVPHGRGCSVSGRREGRWTSGPRGPAALCFDELLVG